jgi:hypothetical protein
MYIFMLWSVYIYKLTASARRRLARNVTTIPPLFGSTSKVLMTLGVLANLVHLCVILVFSVLVKDLTMLSSSITIA